MKAFATPWYYIGGVFFDLVALRNVFYVKSLPEKEAVPGEKKPIW